MAVLLVPTPDWTGRVGPSLMDLCHAPVFMLLAVTGYRWWRQRRPKPELRSVLSIWFLLVGFGVLIEIAQEFVGRTGSRQDALADALGTTAGIVWVCCGSPSMRHWRWIGPSVLLAIAGLSPVSTLVDCVHQHREMPQIASFESPLELTRWEPLNSELLRVRSPASHGNHSLRVLLKPGKYSGATMSWPARNWSGFREFVFDVHLVENESIELVVKIQDRIHNNEHDDRFHRIIRLNPGWQQVKIPLADVSAAPKGRILDLEQVAVVQFFTVGPVRRRTIFLDNLHLQ